MSSEEQRRQFELYKNVERRGKPFFPFAMFHDTVMSFVVVCVIAGLACLWYFTSGEEAGDAGVLGPRYTEESDRDDLPLRPGPIGTSTSSSTCCGSSSGPSRSSPAQSGIPTILLIILILVPFFDRRRERRLIREPVAVVAALLVIASMGVLTYKGRGLARKALASENLEGCRSEFKETQQLPEGRRPGADLRAQLTACLNCHSYLGTGGGFPRRAGSRRGGHPRARGRLADRTPRMPELRSSGLADAAVRRPDGRGSSVGWRSSSRRRKGWGRRLVVTGVGTFLSGRAKTERAKDAGGRVPSEVRGRPRAGGMRRFAAGQADKRRLGRGH